MIENVSGNDLVVDDDDVRHREEGGDTAMALVLGLDLSAVKTTEDISQNAKAKRLDPRLIIVS